MLVLSVFSNASEVVNAFLPIFLDVNAVNVAYDCAKPGTGADVFGRLVTFVGSIQTGLTNIGISVFVIGVIIAGMMRMLAFGSDRRVMFSNMALTGSVVGLAIVLLAGAIKTFVCNINDPVTSFPAIEQVGHIPAPGELGFTILP